MSDENQQSEGVGLVSTDLFARFRAIVNRLDALSFKTLEDPDCEELCVGIENLQEWGCEASKHEWVYDQCGYWQHQYCGHCGAAKYPDMAKQRCGELDAKMGRVSEDEFLKANAESCDPTKEGS